MSRQIYYEANISCCVGPRSAGIVVPFAGVVPIRTVWPLNLVGIVLITVSIYVIPAVLFTFFTVRRYIASLYHLYAGRFRVGLCRVQSLKHTFGAEPIFHNTGCGQPKRILQNL